MASNTGNHRIPVKWIRDKAKAAYVKADCCFICGTTENLELHHLHSVTLLLEKWAHRKSYDVTTDEGILAVRDEFIEDHKVELYDMVYTLCNAHHIKLHGVYGKTPTAASVPKQERWVLLQKDKFLGNPTTEKSPKNIGSFFSAFH